MRPTSALPVMIDEPNKREASKTPDPYELDPTPAAPPAPDPPKPSLGKEGLLEDFDEDADFDRDPEVEQALKGRPREKAQPEEEQPARPIFVTEGRGEPEVIGGVGGLVAILALIVAAATAPADRLAAGFDNLFFTLVHTVMGISAVAAGAHLQGCALGRWSLTFARVLLAVAVFQVVNGVHIGAFPVASRFLLVPLAAGAYLITMYALFRWPRQRLFVVAAVHLLLSFGAWFLFSLYAWIATPAPKA